MRARHLVVLGQGQVRDAVYSEVVGPISSGKLRRRVWVMLPEDADRLRREVRRPTGEPRRLSEHERERHELGEQLTQLRDDSFVHLGGGQEGVEQGDVRAGHTAARPPGPAAPAGWLDGWDSSSVTGSR